MRGYTRLVQIQLGDPVIAAYENDEAWAQPATEPLTLAHIHLLATLTRVRFARFGLGLKCRYRGRLMVKAHCLTTLLDTLMIGLVSSMT